jgi:hypothetical protein
MVWAAAIFHFSISLRLHDCPQPVTAINALNQAPVTDFPASTEPTICAGQCSTTGGCEFFVQTVPTGCYLKGRPFDSDSP